MSGASDLRHRRVVVVGSGFGGALAAWPLVRAGHDVLLLERGPWVPRGPHNWEADGTITRTPYYETDGFARAVTENGSAPPRSAACVGGPSVFYGAVSMRFREADFLPHPEITADSGAAWPFTYDELRPWYDEVERILAVTGAAGEDPTEPPRDAYPAPPSPLSPVSETMARAARALGLRPFRLPLAIHYGTGSNGAGGNGGAEANADAARTPCIECTTCDTFACALEAKNDLATTVLRALERRGLEIRAGTEVVGVHLEGGRVTGVACLDRGSGATYDVGADAVVLAAGALATPRLLLAAGAHLLSPAGDAVGRYLTRHCSGIVFGAYPWLPRHEGRFHKQIGINDFYLGDPAGKGPRGKLGNIQQTQTPNLGTVVGETGPTVGALLAPFVRRATGLLVIAEDRPRWENRVALEEDPAAAGPAGRGAGAGAHGPGRTSPLARVEHRYHDRDLAARRRLYARAREIHRAAGALMTYTHTIHTFSHALGTVRMGDDPGTAPLDAAGRFRGIEGLRVTDGGALPTSGGVNPSLTIAANALRIGTLLAAELAETGRTGGPRGAGGPSGPRGTP